MNVYLNIYNLSNEFNILNLCANLSILSINIGIVIFPILINTLLMVTGSFQIYLWRNIAMRHVKVGK